MSPSTERCRRRTQFRHANCPRCKRQGVPFYLTQQIHVCVECHKRAVKTSHTRKWEQAAFVLFCKIELGCWDFSDQLAAHEWSEASPDVRQRYLRAAKALELKAAG